MTDKQARTATVLVLASTYPRWPNDHEPGFVHELCRRLAARFRVIALVPDSPGADPSGQFDGVTVVRYRYAPRSWQTLVNDGGIAVNLRRARWKWLLVPSFVLAQWIAARRLIRRERIDVVHAHWLLPQGLVAYLLSRGKKAVPYLVTSHGGDLYGLRGRMSLRLKRMVAAAAGAMTVVSRAMAEFAGVESISARRLEVLPMGVDMRERFVPDQGVQRSASEILFVGRMVPKKGLRYLLEAMPTIIAAVPEAQLTLAGFGPEEDSLKAQVQELGIERRVKFLGAMPQKELPALYKRASLFVAPFMRDEGGDQEGLPVVLMEAIGCGCPALVGAVPGIDDLLGDLSGEMSVPPGDSQALAAGAIRALRNPESAQRLARQVRDRALERIDWQQISRAYGDLLQGCMSGDDRT